MLPEERLIIISHHATKCFSHIQSLVKLQLLFLFLLYGLVMKKPQQTQEQLVSLPHKSTSCVVALPFPLQGRDGILDGLISPFGFIPQPFSGSESTLVSTSKRRFDWCIPLCLFICSSLPQGLTPTLSRFCSSFPLSPQCWTPTYSFSFLLFFSSSLHKVLKVVLPLSLTLSPIHSCAAWIPGTHGPSGILVWPV